MELGKDESDVQFQEEYDAPRRDRPERTGLLPWLVNKGIASDTDQASYMLLGVVILIIAIAVAILLSTRNSSPKPSIDAIDAAMQATHPATQ